MLGGQSVIVNGQLVNTPDEVSYLPLSYAPVAPSALWQGQSAATIPPQQTAAINAGPVQTGHIAGLSDHWTNPVTPAGWLHPTRYPVVMAIAFLLLGMVVLRYIHWSG